MPILITYSEVLLCNLALERIGTQSRINSLDTAVDRSTNAASCALWYPQSRDAVLTDFPWTWTQGSAVLSQINTTYPASPEYQYSYQYPVGALDIYAVVPTCTPVSQQTTPPQTTGVFSVYPWRDYWWKRAEGKPCPWGFRINSGPTGRLVMTDLPNATALFTQQITDPTQYSADFVDMLVWRVAVDLSYSIAISDQRRKSAADGYKACYLKTRARMMNEAQSDIPVTRPRSSFVRDRF